MSLAQRRATAWRPRPPVSGEEGAGPQPDLTCLPWGSLADYLREGSEAGDGQPATREGRNTGGEEQRVGSSQEGSVAASFIKKDR